MSYELRKVGDPRRGDVGGMSMLITPGLDEPPQMKMDARPEVGSAIRVGSISARMFGYQDWWQTSLIEEILEDELDYVKFRTINSVYEWRQH